MKYFLFALLAIGLLGVAAQKAQAQFPTFDAATFGELGTIWTQDASIAVRAAQEVQQATKIVTQTLQIYNLARQETQFLEKRQVLDAVGFAASHALVPGHPDWDRTMMTAGGLASAGVTWQNMTNPRMALQYRVSMLNSFASSSLSSLGNCNAAAIQNGTAMGGLQRLATSMDPANNTAASLGVLNNMNQTQALHYQQCQENLAEQRLKLELVRAHEAMDRDQSAIATNTAVDTYNGAGGGEWNTNPEHDYRLTGMH